MKININTGEKDIELSLTEAQAVFEELKILFAKPEGSQWVPDPEPWLRPIPIWPPQAPTLPQWPSPYWWSTTTTRTTF